MKRIPKTLSLGIALISLPCTLISLLYGLPTAAHETEVSGDVGVTQHIEPNDTPRAGESSTAWYALTRRGGEAIPFADCDCQLNLYRQPRSTTSGQTKPVATLPLRAIATEGYSQVPAAQVVFPSLGGYDLVLQGRPKDGHSFKAFEVSFAVTVASGTPLTAPPDKASENKASENKASENKASENKASENKASENKASENKASENSTRDMKIAASWGIGGIGVALGLGCAWQIRRSRSRSDS
jgi:hypothetical protein